MNISQILALLQETLPAVHLEVQTMPVDEQVISLPPGSLRPAIQALLERSDVYHLSTITGQDVDGQIELLYHFWQRGGLTLRITLPRQTPSIDTIIDLIPGAAFYEREIVEMLGVHFAGHPDPKPLILPEDWEAGPPLRQEFTLPEEHEVEQE
jgi:NADH-quinone oxidoreductase subunit C